MIYLYFAHLAFFLSALSCLKPHPRLGDATSHLYVFCSSTLHSVVPLPTLAGTVIIVAFLRNPTITIKGRVVETYWVLPPGRFPRMCLDDHPLIFTTLLHVRHVFDYSFTMPFTIPHPYQPSAYTLHLLLLSISRGIVSALFLSLAYHFVSSLVTHSWKK